MIGLDTNILVRYITQDDPVLFCLSRKWTFRPPAVGNYHVRLGT